MNIKSKLRIAVTSLLTAVTCCVVLCSCDNAIYDGEGDCSVHYKVKFRYDYNMKYGDAFAHEVSSVTLYMIDGSGKVVWQKTESGEALSEDGYAMDVDVDPGKYDMLVWAGSTDNGSYTIPTSTVYTDLTCTLNRQYDENGKAYIEGEVDDLYHGYVTGQDLPDTPGTYYYTVPLVKNTNTVRVVLQQISGDMPDANKFTFTITDSNGTMNWDNSLLSDEDITYYAWHVEKGEADMDWDFTATETDTPAELNAATRSVSYPAAIAELTTCRLMADADTRLVVTNTETGETVFSIPLVQYALMTKDFYNDDMDSQEFLDRQDEYDMVFFLDEGYRWLDTYIYINSWKVVLQHTAL